MHNPFHADPERIAHDERNKVRAAYNHAQYLAERRRMMQHWADYLDGLMGERERTALDLKGIEGKRLERPSPEVAETAIISALFIHDLFNADAVSCAAGCPEIVQCDQPCEQ